MKRLNLIILCLFIGIGAAIAQTMKVKGIVTDEAGEPIVGASILVKGTTTGVTTDFDGKFELTAPNNKSVLVISYIGYKTQELKVSANMKVVLQSESQTLDEVVVTGMAKMDKRLFTGATDRLTADDVKLDGLPEISRALEGRSAGVSVQNVSGTFGSSPKIRVRGATSIYGDSKPLWVVDGVIMEDVVEVSADDLSSGNAETMISSAIAGLNSDDIESFQILKDGSATSIYGARAMAGVIVVTTKKGKAGVSRINYTGEFTMRLKPSYSEFNIMNSQEQMGVYQEMEAKGFLNFGGTYRAANSGVYGKMYKLLNTYDPVTGTFALQNTEAARNAYLRQAEMRNTDWFDRLFETNVMQNHSVSMSGGTEKATFYASLSAMVDPGWSKQSKVQRYTVNLNSTYNLYKNLSLNLIGSGAFRNQRAPGTLSQETDAVHGEVKRSFDINPYSYALNTSRALDANEFYTRNYAPFNIMHELRNNYMDLSVTDLKFQGELKWKILPSLEVGVLGALKYSADFVLTGILEGSYIGYASGTVEGIVGEGTAEELLPEEYLLYSTDFKTYDKQNFQSIIYALAEDLNVDERYIQYNWVLLDAIGISYDEAADSDTGTGFSFMTAACILVGVLVLLAAGLVIYNILKISITKRIKEYGTLRAIGGERGQIYRLVSLQLLILCGAGIPIGLLLGILSAKGVLIAATGLLNPDLFMANSTSELNSAINTASTVKLPMLFASIAVILLFALLAAFPAARYASHVSPTVAMSGQTVKIKRRIKRNRNIRNFEAYYARLNLKRGRGRTAVTILSLVMSITVFVALQSFTGLLDASSSVQDMYFSDYAVTNETVGIPSEAVKTLAENDAVESVSTTRLSVFMPGAGDILPFETDLSVQSHETLQLVNVDEAQLQIYAPNLSAQDKQALKDGTGCLVKNPIAFSYGDTTVQQTDLTAICIIHTCVLTHNIFL